VAEATALERRVKAAYFIEHPQPIRAKNEFGRVFECSELRRIPRVGLVCVDITSGELGIIRREESKGVSGEEDQE